MGCREPGFVGAELSNRPVGRDDHHAQGHRLRQEGPDVAGDLLRRRAALVRKLGYQVLLVLLAVDRLPDSDRIEAIRPEDIRSSLRDSILYELVTIEAGQVQAEDQQQA